MSCSFRRHVVIVGDLNTSHRPLDTCDPASLGPIWPTNPSRIWLKSFLHSPQENPENSSETLKFIDIFRHFHPNKPKAFTCWMSATLARQNNYGCRIDYILADVELAKSTLTSCDICPSVLGSDHCPVKADFDLKIVTGGKYPSLCTKFMPKFFGRQQKLSTFFEKKVPGKNLEEPRSQVTNVIVEEVVEITNSQANKRLFLTDVIVTSSKNKKNVKNSMKGKSVSVPGQTSLKNFFVQKSSIDQPRNSQTVPDSEVSTGFDNVSEVVDKVSDEKLQELPESSSHVSQSSSMDPVTLISQCKSSQDVSSSVSAWKNILRGPDPAPLCKGHKEPCVLKTVNRTGPNRGKKFYMCAKPAGFKGDPNTRCETFIWFGSSGKNMKRKADEAMP